MTNTLPRRVPVRWTRIVLALLAALVSPLFGPFVSDRVWNVWRTKVRRFAGLNY